MKQKPDTMFIPKTDWIMIAIEKDATTMIKPIMALVILPLAASRAFGSPEAVIHWTPPINRENKKARPATKKASWIRLSIRPARLVNPEKFGISKIGSIVS